MNGEATVDRGTARYPVLLLTALCAGPLAASLQLSVNYALVKWACAHGGAWVLATLAAALLAVSLGGAMLAGVHLVRLENDRDGTGWAWSADSRRVLAATALGLDVLLGIFLVNTLIAIATLTPCE